MSVMPGLVRDHPLKITALPTHGLLPRQLGGEGTRSGMLTAPLQDAASWPDGPSHCN